MELFFGSLGNGITVCDKSEQEHGDYKHIAHISPGGNINLHVKEKSIPADAMKKINTMAENQRQSFQAEFEKLPDIVQYGKILDNCSLNQMIKFIDDARLLPEKLPAMRKHYYNIV